MKRCISFALILVGLCAAYAVFGCATCAECRGDEARPSPQSAGWQNVGRGEPQPTPPVPPPYVPTRDFATPPTDGPDQPTPAPTPPAPPEPPPAPTTPQNGRAKVTTTKETEGASVIVEQHAAGTIVINSPGAAFPSANPSQAAAPIPQATPIAPILTAVASNPQVQSFVGKALKRTGGALYYLSTGQCPKADPAPASYVAMVPQTTYAAVPLQMFSLPAAYALQAPAPAMVPMQMPMQAPMSTPQFAVAAPPAQKKCRFFP